MTTIDEQVEVLMFGAEYGDPKTKENMRAELRERLIEAEKEGRPLRVYAGYDPTKPDLHLGHTISMRKLRQFQDFGHDVTFLVGTFTSLIGDPSDKGEARAQLTPEQVEENAQTYAEQAFKILDPEKTTIRRNHEWLGQLDFGDVIHMASNFTVQQFLARDNFSKRYEAGTPIYLHEFFYALMQAYDAVALNTDVQVGGQDQLFNIVVAGRKLQSAMGQKPQVSIIMGEILPGTDGVEKMSKSAGNHIPVMGEPWDMFGKIMSIPDSAMPIYHKLLLGWQPNQLAELENALADGSLHPNDAKMNLARQIVTIFHGEEGAEAAQKRWDEVFRSKGDGIPEDIPEQKLTDETRVLDILRDANMVSSGKEFKQLVQNGGIRLNGDKLEDAQSSISPDALPVVVQVGKRKFLRLVSE
ncbi:MAG: tyrosine--tRNA ligase [Anaerolineaceae bacterium]|nr:tyrosine--tRNA ligase [Anaerolineaceae bacterium]